MVRAEELRREEEIAEVKEDVGEEEEIAEVKEDVGEEEIADVKEEVGEEEKDVVMFENAILKTKVMELELERKYLQHKLAVANKERRRRVKRLHTRLCSYCSL